MKNMDLYHWAFTKLLIIHVIFSKKKLANFYLYKQNFYLPYFFLISYFVGFVQLKGIINVGLLFTFVFNNEIKSKIIYLYT